MKLDYAALREVAEAATPGPWTYKNATSGGHETDFGWVDEIYYGDRVNDAKDALYIARFDPPTVLALLDHIEKLERVAEAAKPIAEWRGPFNFNYNEQVDAMGCAIKALEESE